MRKLSHASTNATIRIRLVHSDSGRAQACNAGAKAATGDIIHIVHSDTIVPKYFDRYIRQALCKDDVIAGSFTFKINPDSTSKPLLGMGWIEYSAATRNRVFNLPYGDQVYHAILVYSKLCVVLKSLYLCHWWGGR